VCLGIKTGIKQKVITFIPRTSKKGRQHTQAGQRDVRTIQNPGKRTHLAIKFHFKIEIFARRAFRDLSPLQSTLGLSPQPVYPVLYGTRWTRPPECPVNSHDDLLLRRPPLPAPPRPTTAAGPAPGTLLAPPTMYLPRAISGSLAQGHPANTHPARLRASLFLLLLGPFLPHDARV
jgi:hypothetical protein